LSYECVAAVRAGRKPFPDGGVKIFGVENFLHFRVAPIFWLAFPTADERLLASHEDRRSAMKSPNLPLLWAASLMLGLSTPTFAQESEPEPAEVAQETEEVDGVEGVENVAGVESEEDSAFAKFIASIDWKTGGKGAVGTRAEIEVPAGYRFTGGPGTVRIMEAYGNLTSGNELGFLAPDDLEWFAMFTFSDVGYVKDDDKDSLDADAILSQMKEGQKAANEEMERRGLGTLEVTGWHTKPFYNPQTNNLEWAIRLRSSEGGESINYKTKLLGRRGVMDVVLVCDESQMSTVLPEYQKLLDGFAFKAEESYAAFQKGDKIAEYGLTGLILGGGLLMAAKSGLLAKFWKPIAAGLVIAGAFIKRLITGRSSKETI